MTDNTTLNPGSGGDVYASDDIGPGVKYQRVKLTLGADGVNDGDVAIGNPMPVEGAAAEDAAAAGNPVLVGGRFDTVPRVLETGDAGAVAVTADGAVVTGGLNASSVATAHTVDAAGRQQVVGATGENNAAAGNPLLVGGRYDATPRTLGDGDVGAQAQDVAGRVQVVGPVAHDAAVSGAPHQIAGEARTSNPTAVANGDVARLQVDTSGRVVTTGGAPRGLVTQGTITLTTTTETTLLAAGGAGVFLDLTMLVMVNSGSSGTLVSIRDATTGTVRMNVWLAPNGGGAVIPLHVPFEQTTANNNWTAQLGTASTSVYINAQAVQR